MLAVSEQYKNISHVKANILHRSIDYRIFVIHCLELILIISEIEYYKNIFTINVNYTFMRSKFRLTELSGKQI